MLSRRARLAVWAKSSSSRALGLGAGWICSVRANEERSRAPAACAAHADLCSQMDRCAFAQNGTVPFALIVRSRCGSQPGWSETRYGAPVHLLMLGPRCAQLKPDWQAARCRSAGGSRRPGLQDYPSKRGFGTESAPRRLPYSLPTPPPPPCRLRSRCAVVISTSDHSAACDVRERDARGSQCPPRTPTLRGPTQVWAARHLFLFGIARRR